MFHVLFTVISNFLEFHMNLWWDRFCGPVG